MKAITKNFPGEEPIDQYDYEKLVDRDIKRIYEGKVDPYMPKWGQLINRGYPIEAFRKMGQLKEQIRQVAKQSHIDPGKHSLDGIRNQFDRLAEEDSEMYTLAQFSGVSDSDADAVRNKKMDDFIYMTLMQSDHRSNWLQNLGARTPGEELKGKSATGKGNQQWHNLLASIGQKRYKLFGYLANKKDSARDAISSQDLIDRASSGQYQLTPEDIQRMNQNNEQQYAPEYIQEAQDYTDESLNVIMGLLDHHSDINNFLNLGMKHNAVDRTHRTNTELYYMLKGEEPPEHISAVIDLYKEGEQASGTGKLQKGSWYDAFFREFSGFDQVFRGRDKTLSRLESIKQEKNEYYEKSNKRFLKLLNNPKHGTRPDRGYQAMLATIKDPALRAEIEKGATNVMDDISTKLPLGVYKALGFAAFEGVMKKLDQKEKNTLEGKTTQKGTPVPGIPQLKEKTQEINDNLKQICMDNNVSPEKIKAMRLASEAYKRSLLKIASLEKMKKHSMKFASTDYVDYIDLQIARVKTEFDHYFNSLFL